ncbi:hypothetical protein M9Y10_024468 [Tritrichomonas musculus]|uniref:Uncharacterized protein n=1 Tax=Tritrichomonas musculus TaxID=1915356 RepID=A0ABR2HC29_9EUKA
MFSRNRKHRKWGTILVKSDDPLAPPKPYPLNNLELLVHKFKPNPRRNGREIFQNLLKEIEERKKREQQQQQQQDQQQQQQQDQQQQQQQDQQQQQQQDQQQQQQQDQQLPQQQDEELELDPMEIISIEYLLNKH